MINRLPIYLNFFFYNVAIHRLLSAVRGGVDLPEYSGHLFFMRSQKNKTHFRLSQQSNKSIVILVA